MIIPEYVIISIRYLNGIKYFYSNLIENVIAYIKSYVPSNRDIKDKDLVDSINKALDIYFNPKKYNIKT